MEQHHVTGRSTDVSFFSDEPARAREAETRMLEFAGEGVYPRLEIVLHL